jgi:hypothetical protein
MALSRPTGGICSGMMSLDYAVLLIVVRILAKNFRDELEYDKKRVTA